MDPATCEGILDDFDARMPRHEDPSSVRLLHPSRRQQRRSNLGKKVMVGNDESVRSALHQYRRFRNRCCRIDVHRSIDPTQQSANRLNVVRIVIDDEDVLPRPGHPKGSTNHPSLRHLAVTEADVFPIYPQFRWKCRQCGGPLADAREKVDGPKAVWVLGPPGIIGYPDSELWRRRAKANGFWMGRERESISSVFFGPETVRAYTRLRDPVSVSAPARSSLQGSWVALDPGCSHSNRHPHRPIARFPRERLRRFAHR